jgi:predicted kinase
MEADQPRRPGQPEVVLICGVAGSGKTTYPKGLEIRGCGNVSTREPRVSTPMAHSRITDELLTH